MCHKTQQFLGVCLSLCKCVCVCVWVWGGGQCEESGGMCGVCVCLCKETTTTCENDCSFFCILPRTRHGCWSCGCETSRSDIVLTRCHSWVLRFHPQPHRRIRPMVLERHRSVQPLVGEPVAKLYWGHQPKFLWQSVTLHPMPGCMIPLASAMTSTKLGQWLEEAWSAGDILWIPKCRHWLRSPTDFLDLPWRLWSLASCGRSLSFWPCTCHPAFLHHSPPLLLLSWCGLFMRSSIASQTTHYSLLRGTLGDRQASSNAQCRCSQRRCSAGDNLHIAYHSPYDPTFGVQTPGGGSNIWRGVVHDTPQNTKGMSFPRPFGPRGHTQGGVLIVHTLLYMIPPISLLGLKDGRFFVAFFYLGYIWPLGDHGGGGSYKRGVVIVLNEHFLKCAQLCIFWEIYAQQFLKIFNFTTKFMHREAQPALFNFSHSIWGIEGQTF